MNKNYAEVLDELLKMIATNTEYYHIENQLEEKFGVKGDEKNNMVDFLIQGDYVLGRNIGDVKITLKGRDWISSEIGGFTKEREDKINERNRLISSDTLLTGSTAKLARWTKYLTYGTLLVGIATVCLVLVELGKELGWFPHYDCG